MTLLRTLALAAVIIAPTAAGAEPIGTWVTPVRDTTALGQTKPPRRPEALTFRGAATGRAMPKDPTRRTDGPGRPVLRPYKGAPTGRTDTCPNAVKEA